MQCTRAIKAAEALLPGAEPKVDFEYGKVCCKVAGRQVHIDKITHDYEKFIWRIEDGKAALGVDLNQEHIDKKMERLDNEYRAAREMGLQPPLTWNTGGLSQVSSLSFVAIQEYGRTEQDAPELGGYCWRQAAPSDNIFHGHEAKSFVVVQFSRHAVVAELRQYVPMSLHFLHAGSSATEYSEACQEASRMISKVRTHSLKPVFLGMDSSVEFAWPSDTMIGEHSLWFPPTERWMLLWRRSKIVAAR